MILHLETRGRLRLVVLDRSAARNAVDPALARALYAAFRAVEDDPAVDAAVLAGAGGAFCAGFDLKAASRPEGAGWIAGLDIPEDWTDPVARPLPGPMGPTRLVLSKPVIAAIEGHAVAGGLELALWCDLRIATRDAVLGVYCRRWGVPLIDGGTVRLPQVVGLGRAADLILTGRGVAGPEALAMGLVDRLVEPGAALATAVELAQGLGRFPQATMRADLNSARMPPAELATRLRREWAGGMQVLAEGLVGAGRFASGLGRGGRFDDLPAPRPPAR